MVFESTACTGKVKGSPPISAEALDRVNADLLRISCLFLNQKGLPERPWFKNQIYAPGAYTGYGAKPIAGGARIHGREEVERSGRADSAKLRRSSRMLLLELNKAAADAWKLQSRQSSDVTILRNASVSMGRYEMEVNRSPALSGGTLRVGFGG